MKKLLSLVVLICAVLGVYGQDGESPGLNRKYVVKFSPANYMLQSYPIEIERMINGKNSLILGVGIPRSGSLIGKYGMEEPDDVTKADLSTMHLRAAYRHYSGKSRLPKGFYIEPYLKYQNIKANMTASFETENEGITETFEGDVDANITTLNAGFQLGTQFLIAKRVSLDFYFFGLEAGLGNANVTGTPKQPDAEKIAEMRDEIQNGVDDLPSFLRDKIEVTSTNESVKVKASSLPYPWFRAGISIGIAF